MHLGAELYVAIASKLVRLTRPPIHAWPLWYREHWAGGQEAWGLVSSLHLCVPICGSTPAQFSFPGTTAPTTTAFNIATLPQHASSLL